MDMNVVLPKNVTLSSRNYQRSQHGWVGYGVSFLNLVVRVGMAHFFPLDLLLWNTLNASANSSVVQS